MEQLLEQARHLNAVGRFRDAERTLEHALRSTDRLTDDDQVAARARVMITLAWTTVSLHGRAPALDLLAAVRRVTDSPRLLALSYIQEAVVHVSCTDWREALSALDQVGPAFEQLTPREQVAALLNGGLSHLSLLELDPARLELDRAVELSVAEGLAEQEFKARHNLGCLEFYAGRLPDAIRLMRAADEMEVSVDRARAKHDLALALLEAGLLDQAQEMLTAALDRARSESLRLQEGDIRLDLALCATLRGDAGTARAELDEAIRAFRSRGAQQRQRSAALLRAAVDVDDGVVPRRTASLLAPWLQTPRATTPDERLAARVQAQTLLLRGDVEGAGYAVGRLRGRVRQGLAGQMQDSLIMARVAAAQGDSRRARRVVRTALSQLTTRQAPSQSLEIRAAMALHGRRLGEFDLADSLSSRSERRVFDSVERWRAVSHRLPPVSGAADPQTVDLMAQLRQARRALGDAAVADVDGQRERAAELEWRISQREWATGDDARTAGVSPAISFAAARELLDERHEHALVLFAHRGTQYVLAMGGSQPGLQALGSVSQVRAQAEQLLRDLRAHAFAATTPPLEQALARAVAKSAEALGELVVGGVELSPGAGVVVVPDKALVSVPWAMLPQLAGRPVTVAPSVTRWSTPLTGVRTFAPAGGGLPPVALTGPGLRRATAEIEGVAASWQALGLPMELRLGADSDMVKAALAASELVHIAAHGRHEEQSPFFSSLRMTDGPVFAHELPREVGARHVVLSACDVGQANVRPGDEPLGLTAALLSLGVGSVVAAVAPVRDEVAEAAMVAYHRRLAEGQAASQALARAVEEHPGARAFCLFGSDWRAQIHRAGSLNIAS